MLGIWRTGGQFLCVFSFCFLPFFFFLGIDGSGILCFFFFVFFTFLGAIIGLISFRCLRLLSCVT